MSYRQLPSRSSLRGKIVLVRVDWNVPMLGGLAPEESLKIERTLPTLQGLARRGAVVAVLTHLGRPEKWEARFSTSRLASLLSRHYHTPIQFHEESVSDGKARAQLCESLRAAPTGSIHLLENVRFEKGEEKNDAKLAKAYAAVGDLFVNDAFASSHRSHASVVGIAKQLPSYAGSALLEEVKHLSRLQQKPIHPFVVVIGGLKLSTKVPVLRSLLPRCDRLLIGGAMAATFAASNKRNIGKSFVEKMAFSAARTLGKHRKIVLPEDVAVTERVTAVPKLRFASMDAIDKREIIVDIGPKTLRAWGEILQGARTILWNGPVGIAEVHACGFGSRFLARTIGKLARGKAFAVVGGGDTLPILVETRTTDAFDFVSTGGGALLEFLAKKGKLPGLTCLLKK